MSWLKRAPNTKNQATFDPPSGRFSVNAVHKNENGVKTNWIEVNIDGRYIALAAMTASEVVRVIDDAVAWLNENYPVGPPIPAFVAGEEGILEADDDTEAL